MRLIVGLGNPGSEYGHTRHNVGFWTINRLARRHGIELRTGGQAALGEGQIAGRSVALAKPRTFVNESGSAVWNLIKQLKLDDAAELLVICDDLDLPAGKIRVRAGGGHGGHKGLRSIIERTGSDAFPRLRIGIGRPLSRGQPSWDPEVVANHVLSEPAPAERALLEDAAERAADAIEVAITEGIEAAMGRFN
ncbi:MAG: aminoacyl-tRNA hydrolase [Chloroflexi bacterium]|nr:aminoacyl-tRNA hydrolase [Chloroflexota bacterium]